MKISCDNKFVVSSSQDKTIRVWNLDNKRQEAVLEGHTSFVKTLAISSDTKFIVSGSFDHTIMVILARPIHIMLITVEWWS